MNNSLALATMMRNRLFNNKYSLSDKMTFFHDKGVTILNDCNYIFLKSDRRGHTSELSDICNGLIYKDGRVVCFHGKETPTVPLSDAQKSNIIWNDNTVLMDHLSGIVAYLFWDTDLKNWQISDDKQPVSPYASLIKPQIYNIMSLEPRYTYELCLVQEGEASGLYLISAYDNKTLKELTWRQTDPIAGRHQFFRPMLYAFTSLKDIEGSELPLLVVDQSLNKIILT
jgi:hypothetical protein